MSDAKIKTELSVPFLARFRTQLFVLILLVFVPLSILTIHTNFNERRAKKQNTREKAIAAARLTAAKQENFVKNAEQLLATVSHFAFLVSNKDRAFTQIHFTNLRAIFPEYLDFGLIESNGTLFCSTVITNGTLNLSTWSCFQRAVRTRQFAIGDLVETGTTTQPTLDFAYPVFNQKGTLTRILYASLDISRFRKTVDEIDLPKGATVTIFDGSGRVLARRPDPGPEKKAGKTMANDPFVRQILDGKEMVFEMAGLDQIEKLFAVATINDGSKKRLWVSVGIPTKTLFASANRDLWRSIVIMALVALLALAAAYSYAERFFLHPLQLLISEARLLAAGEWSIRAETPRGKGELGELARTFNEMAMTLDKQRADINTINAELEQRVRDRTLQLEQAGRELEAFSYSVSHDLRAPVRHIAGFVDLLRNELGNSISPKSGRLIGILADSAKQMGRLIDDLLIFSKMGRVEMQKTVVNTSELVDETIASLVPETKERKIIWKKGSLPELQADPAMLRQVLVNLLSNAIKYSQPRDPAIVEIGSKIEENETIIFIRDNGVGFDMRFADKLFGVFQRLHQADEFEGTGIGLANVRRIIQRHRGRTWAEGKVGEGATFYFSLPKSNNK